MRLLAEQNGEEFIQILCFLIMIIIVVIILFLRDQGLWAGSLGINFSVSGDAAAGPWGAGVGGSASSTIRLSRSDAPGFNAKTSATHQRGLARSRHSGRHVKAYEPAIASFATTGIGPLDHNGCPRLRTHNQ